MLRLNWARAAAWRSHRHHLDERAAAGSLLDVARRLCGLHAQILSSAELAAWARVEKLAPGAVRRALWEERSLVKTWAMRGTLHLLAADEIPEWHAALGTSRRHRREAGWKKYFGITLAELDELTVAIGEALEGQVLTREALVAAVARRVRTRRLAKKLGEGSWGTILKPAAFTGRLCFGPSVGQKVQFTHPRSWLGGARRDVEPGTATAAVTRRFLGAYGPATVVDLGRWWSGNEISTGKAWLQALGDEVTPVEIDGTPAFLLADDARELRELSPRRSVRLLPLFDPYVVAASPHADKLLPGDFRRRVYRPQGWISPVLLVNGRMEGTWTHTLRGSKVEVAIAPFVGVPAWARRAAGLEAERLAEFLGGKLELIWS